ncbi:MAG: hypothetical protein GY757_47985 [bacterium]|nr:hypothetical protein [bacterium]
MDKIILESYTDAAVIVCCILILFLRRYRRLTEKGYPLLKPVKVRDILRK